MIGTEQTSEWYDNNIWCNIEKMTYNRKGGLYELAYSLFHGKNVIDVGCGSGRLSYVFRE
jgi:ribosomal protein L11 methylase PrmA